MMLTDALYNELDLIAIFGGLFCADSCLQSPGQHQQQLDLATRRLLGVLSIFPGQDFLVRGRCGVPVPPRQPSDRYIDTNPLWFGRAV